MDSRLIKDLGLSVAQFYEKNGAAFSRTRHQHWDVFEVIKEYVKTGDTLVDVGAGNGRLADFLPKDISYIGIEPSSSLRADNPSIQSGSLPLLPVKDGTADLTTCLAVFHHIPGDRKSSVDELARITKSGGIIIATAWMLDPAKHETVKDGEQGDIWVNWSAEGVEDKRYVHIFGEDEWKNLWTHPDLEWIDIGLDKNGLNRMVVARKT